ncbi:MAG: 2-iminoacetate synthase ThiH [Desulfovibrio sp.]|jgi:2-iminoacetate synthase|nr:2-iminoacetate synthase ThiH [Desulfovibrio sp.]
MCRENRYIPLADGFAPKLAGCARLFAESVFAAGPGDVRRALGKDTLNEKDFAALLSPAAGAELEALARRARDETMRRFGRARQLFAPIYLGNYCTNKCVYCGFHAGTGIRRKALTPDEIEAEAEALYAVGLRRVLALTGDAPKRTGADYIAAAVEILARRFSSVGIEVQALTFEEYAGIARAGADSMTMFQETYDAEIYARLHPSGPKRVFANRLDAPQRAAAAGMRAVNLGALLGLGDWRSDIFMTGMHALFLQRRFPGLEIGFSLPRIRPAKSDSSFSPTPVPDRCFVQALTALRCFMPYAGITLSTRESAVMRDKLLPLGVTRVSAGVCTGVGGYARPAQDGSVQWDIDDRRSVAEMAADLEKLGYSPVFSDWLLPGGGDLPLAGALRDAVGATETGA